MPVGLNCSFILKFMYLYIYMILFEVITISHFNEITAMQIQSKTNYVPCEPFIHKRIIHYWSIMSGPTVIGKGNYVLSKSRFRG